MMIFDFYIPETHSKAVSERLSFNIVRLVTSKALFARRRFANDGASGKASV